MSHDPPSIHPTAVVEDGAVIGRGSAVWHHGHIRTGARIGAGCTLGKNVFVDAAAVIGNRVKIQNNVSVYSGITLGDDVFVGPSAVFTNDLYPRASDEWTRTETTVEAGASIGANATIIAGVTIGAAAMIGAGTVVTRDVPANALVVGNPARQVGWVDASGAVISRDISSRPAGLDP